MNHKLNNSIAITSIIKKMKEKLFKVKKMAKRLSFKLKLTKLVIIPLYHSLTKKTSIANFALLEFSQVAPIKRKLSYTFWIHIQMNTKKFQLAVLKKTTKTHNQNINSNLRMYLITQLRHQLMKK